MGSFSATVLDLEGIQIVNGKPEGTALVLKDHQKDIGTLLGFVVSAPSFPRWMSSEFGAALDEHNQGVEGTDLNIYSHDWFEQIVFVPIKALDDEETAQGIADWSQKTVRLTKSLDHFLSTGCSTVVPRTRVRQVEFDTGDNSKVSATTRYSSPSYVPADVFYAVVSQYVDDDPNKRPLEIVIAPLQSRKAWASSETHVTALQNCYAIRHKAVISSSVTLERSAAFNAVKAFQGAP